MMRVNIDHDARQYLQASAFPSELLGFMPVYEILRALLSILPIRQCCPKCTVLLRGYCRGELDYGHPDVHLPLWTIDYP